MNKVINEKLIERNKKIGKILSFVGIGVLAVGLILNFNPTPTRLLISLGALVLGFIISQISTFYVTRFNRKPRSDEIIAENLSKLGNDYSFYIYNSPIPMLLVGPTHIWIPVPVMASGEVYYNKKWKERGGSFLVKLLGQGNIGQSEREVKDYEKQIHDFLQNTLENEELPPVKSIFVILNPKVTVGDVEEAPIPIVHAAALRRKIRKFDRDSEKEISSEIIEKLNNKLNE